MAQIKQVGVGRKSTGTIDGITYYVRGGVTYARSTPNMPASAYNTPAAKKRQALFKLIQMHLKYHLRTIRQTFTPKGNETPTNRYYSVNAKALGAALDTLADQYCAGEVVTIVEVEAAISAYAAAHEKAIIIASKSGYNEVYLEGTWPETITLNAKTGDSTVIIIVNEYGQQTTINADGTITTGTYDGSSSGNQNQNGGGSGSSQSSGAGGTSQGSGGTTPGVPTLTINRYGSGSASVTAGGNAVNSGAELAEGTEVSLSVTPAAGATPTATLNSSPVTLTENGGVYTGSFTMPATNATLTINTGSSGGSDAD